MTWRKWLEQAGVIFSGRSISALFLAVLFGHGQAWAMSPRPGVSLLSRTVLAASAPDPSQSIEDWGVEGLFAKLSDDEQQSVQATLSAKPAPGLEALLGAPLALGLAAFRESYEQANGVSLEKLEGQAEQIAAIPDEEERAKSAATFRQGIKGGTQNLTVALLAQHGAPKELTQALPQLFDAGFYGSPEQQGAFLDLVGKYASADAREQVARILGHAPHIDPAGEQALTCGQVDVVSIILGVALIIAAVLVAYYGGADEVPICDPSTGACALVPGYVAAALLAIAGIALIVQGANASTMGCAHSGGSGQPVSCARGTFFAPYDAASSGSDGRSGAIEYVSVFPDDGEFSIDALTSNISPRDWTRLQKGISVIPGYTHVAVTAMVKDASFTAQSTTASMASVRATIRVYGPPAAGGGAPVLKCSNTVTLRQSAQGAPSLNRGTDASGVNLEPAVTCAFPRATSDDPHYTVEVEASTSVAVLRYVDLSWASFQGRLDRLETCSF